MITITIMIMGAPAGVKRFSDKAGARVFFLRHAESVCCYPVVTVNGVELRGLPEARRYFGIKEDKRTRLWREKMNRG